MHLELDLALFIDTQICLQLILLQLDRRGTVKTCKEHRYAAHQSILWFVKSGGFHSDIIFNAEFAQTTLTFSFFWPQ